jgi:CYTH domain-containing protein
MSIEIERKFLVKSDEWRSLGTLTRIRQGYLVRSKECTVRIRETEKTCFLTIKGAARDGLSRSEFEYEIPRDDAAAMLDSLAVGGIIDKTRTVIKNGEHTWEVDEFFGDNSGLIIAEIELSHPDEAFDRPEWLGREVTFEPRFTNAALAHRPYCSWSDDEKS